MAGDVGSIVSGSQAGQSAVDNNVVAIPGPMGLPLYSPESPSQKAADEQLAKELDKAGNNLSKGSTYWLTVAIAKTLNTLGIATEKSDNSKSKNNASNGNQNVSSGGSAMSPGPDDDEYKNYKQNYQKAIK